MSSEARDSNGFPRTGVTDVYKPPCGCLGLNLGPWKKVLGRTVSILKHGTISPGPIISFYSLKIYLRVSDRGLFIKLIALVGISETAFLCVRVSFQTLGLCVLGTYFISGCALVPE